MEERKNIDYQNFKASDFALDDTFIDWVKNPDGRHSDFWEDWCKYNTGKLDEVESARILVLSFQFEKKLISSREIEGSWEELRSRSNIDTKRYNSWKGNSGFNNFLRIAAILVLATCFIFILNNFQTIIPVLSEQTTIRKEAQVGQKLTLVLPDGSQVKLNAESSIKYPGKFANNIREVELDGEAFFEVSDNREKPFRVKTGNITTEVLGTSFNINSYPESSQIQVALVEGKVKVINTGQSVGRENIILEKGDILTFDKNSNDFSIKSFDQEDILCWKEGILNFDKISFAEAIKKMERWYGVKFTIDEKAAVDPTWRIHGKFKNQSIAYILDVVSYPDLFNYKIQEDTIIIY